MGPQADSLKYDVAVIGAGASGTLVALQLLRQATRPLQVCLIERRAEMGEGAAYSTKEEVHLLNVPAIRMSALPDQEEHFLRWMKIESPSTQPGDFVPRLRFGQYLRWSLGQARAQSRASLTTRAGEVVDLSRETAWLIRLQSGEMIFADTVVLATGLEAPAQLGVQHGGLYESHRYGKSPWGLNPMPVPSKEPVLLLGTGLTAVDAVLSLRGQGHRAQIHAISRHGHLPQSHALKLPAMHIEPQGTQTLTQLAREMRRQIEADGGDWRAAVDALRPFTQTLWKQLPPGQQGQFLRHLRNLWEVHRHRMAPEVAATMDALKRTGELQIHSGRVLDLRLQGDEVRVQFRPRGQPSVTQELRVSYVLNCMGPSGSMSRTLSQPIQSLLKNGWARPDAMDMGLDADEEGRVICQTGSACAGLFTLGPLLKGTLWETTAIPEIAVQAQKLAHTLLANLDHERLGGPGLPP